MKIYDNGGKLLGIVKDLKKYILSEEEDKELNKELLEELNELDDNAIVSINYDFGMGVLYDVWNDKDIVEIKETGETKKDDFGTYLFDKDNNIIYVSLSSENLEDLESCEDYFTINLNNYVSKNHDDSINELVNKVIIEDMESENLMYMFTCLNPIFIDNDTNFSIRYNLSFGYKEPTIVLYNYKDKDKIKIVLANLPKYMKDNNISINLN